jgi:hypothetical protein
VAAPALAVEAGQQGRAPSSRSSGSLTRSTWAAIGRTESAEIEDGRTAAQVLCPAGGGDDERPPPYQRGARSFSDRATGPNVCLSTRAKTFGGANASTITSAPSP